MYVAQEITCTVGVHGVVKLYFLLNELVLAPHSDIYQHVKQVLAGVMVVYSHGSSLYTAHDHGLKHSGFIPDFALL